MMTVTLKEPRRFSGRTVAPRPRWRGGIDETVEGNSIGMNREAASNYACFGWHPSIGVLPVLSTTSLHVEAK
jgi:hypothetical protein